MKIRHQTAHTVSAGGETYVAEDGVFDVPEEHAMALVESHGFEVVEETVRKARDKKQQSE